MQTGQAQIVFQYTLSGDVEPMINTLGFDLGTVAIDAATAQDCHDIWTTEVMSLLSTSLTLVSTTVEFFDGTGTVGATYAADPNAGSRTGETLPQNTCYLVRKTTGSSGRGRYGRMYLPGVPENKVNGTGVVDSGELAAWNIQLASALTSLNTALSAGNGLVVNHGPGPAPSGTSEITGLVLDPRVATQRRRLRR